MSAILESFAFLDKMNATMAPEYSDKHVAALGAVFADHVRQLGHSLMLRDPAGEVVEGYSTLALWVEIENRHLKARLVFGNRQRADWSSVVPSKAFLVNFDTDADALPIDTPTLQEIGDMLCKESWQIGFRSNGYIRMLITFAGTRVTKEGAAA